MNARRRGSRARGAGPGADRRTAADPPIARAAGDHRRDAERAAGADELEVPEAPHALAHPSNVNAAPCHGTRSGERTGWRPASRRPSRAIRVRVVAKKSSGSAPSSSSNSVERAVPEELLECRGRVGTRGMEHGGRPDAGAVEPVLRGRKPGLSKPAGRSRDPTRMRRTRDPHRLRSRPRAGRSRAGGRSAESPPGRARQAADPNQRRIAERLFQLVERTQRRRMGRGPRCQVVSRVDSPRARRRARRRPSAAASRGRSRRHRGARQGNQRDQIALLDASVGTEGREADQRRADQERERRETALCARPWVREQQVETHDRPGHDHGAGGEREHQGVESKRARRRLRGRSRHRTRPVYGPNTPAKPTATVATTANASEPTVSQ